MNVDEALCLLDKLLQQRLSNIQELVLRQTWDGLTYAEIAESSGYETDYIKFVGFQLWHILSNALGEKVTKSNFKSVLRRTSSKNAELTSTYQNPLLHANYSAATKQDWQGAIDSVFYGRTPEIAKLQRWIVEDQCRLVTLMGMGGIGKTALSVKVAQIVQNRFEFVIWRSLRDAPSLTELLTTLIKFISQQQEIHLPHTVGGKISRLLEYLQTSRCLLILDNFETILSSNQRAGSYRPEYEEYGELLQQVGEIPHQSCLLLTSREKPAEIAVLEGKILSVRTLQLPGLRTPAGQEMLRSQGLSGSVDEIEQLIESYRGNPLALKIAATSILDLFDDIADFLAQGTIVFNGIRNLLARQIQRLSPLEEQIMYWLAINREPVSATQLQADIVPAVSRSHIIETLESLSWRSLIEKNIAGFTQQPVVMEYIIDQLIERICTEITTGTIEFFHRYALIKATAKDYIRDSQIRVILAPILANLHAHFQTSAAIEQHLQQILTILRTELPTPGYGGGNTINLLRQLQVDFTSYDFSALTIWQADLSGVNLHRVNFANTNFAQCSFTEALVNTLWVDFSRDGQLIVTSDANGSVRLWNAADGQPLRSYEGHIGWVWTATFSNDGTKLASCGDDGMIKLWNVKTGQCLHTLQEHSMRGWSVSFSPDGTLLASGSADRTIKIWDVNTGKCLKTLHGHTNVLRSVAFSRDGKILASGSEDRTVKLWDVSSGQCLHTWQEHTDGVWSVAFSPHGKILASGSADHTVKLWDINSGQCWQTLKGPQIEFVWSITFSVDGTIAVAGEAPVISLWNVNGQCVQTFQGFSRRIWSVAFSPDGGTLASAGEDQALRLWQVATGQCYQTIKGYSGRVWSVSFSPDGETLASSVDDETVRLWDVATRKC